MSFIINDTMSEDTAKAIYKQLCESGELRSPEGVKLAVIENIEVLDKKNKDGQAYQQIQLDFRAFDGKRYNKRMSVDFARKLFTQFEVSSEDLYGSLWAIKPTGVYKNVGFSAIVIGDAEEGDEIGEENMGAVSYKLKVYVDEALDFRAKLKALGL